MKYVARIKEVLRPGIHGVGTIENGALKRPSDFPTPDRVEIRFEEPESAWFMYRYTSDDKCCGDTWHQQFEDALHQAKYEYGLERNDFLMVHEP